MKRMRVDLNAKDGKNEALLHIVAKSGHIDIVKALIKAGAEVNIRDEYNWTALHNAAAKGKFSSNGLNRSICISFPIKFILLAIIHSRPCKHC